VKWRVVVETINKRQEDTPWLNFRTRRPKPEPAQDEPTCKDALQVAAPQTAREWVEELLYKSDGRNRVLDEDDAIELADRADAAEAELAKARERIGELAKDRAAAYRLLERIAYPARRSSDESASLQNFADEIQRAYTLDQLTERDQ
jgi:hypothetical protein